MARLDKAFISPEWRSKYENAFFVHEGFGTSDHRLLVIQLHCKHKITRRRFSMKSSRKKIRAVKKL